MDSAKTEGERVVVSPKTLFGGVRLPQHFVLRNDERREVREEGREGRDLRQRRVPTSISGVERRSRGLLSLNFTTIQMQK